MDVRTDKSSYTIPPESSTGKTSIIGVTVTVDYKTGDPAGPKDWVAFVPAGQAVPDASGLKDSHGNMSEWRYTNGVDFKRAMSVPCLDKTTMENYGGPWEAVVFADDGYTERKRTAFTIAA